MCFECWDDAGRPAIVNDRTVRAAKLIAAVFEESAVGGKLHVLIDDWNEGNEIVEFCRGVIETEAERECLNAIDLLSVDERISALAIHEGFVFP